MAKTDPKNESFTTWLIKVFLIAIVYFIAAKLGLRLAFLNASATAVWPPTGIGLAVLMLWGYEYWPAIFLAAFFANLTTAGTLVTTVAIATGNTLESVLGVYLINQYASGKEVFEKPITIFKYILLVGVLATAVSATLGVSSLYLAGLANNYVSVWLTWWLGDMSGALVVAPFLVLWLTKRRQWFTANKILEAVSLLAVVLLTCWIIFSNYLPLPFLLFPSLIWAAFRFGRRGVSLTVLFVAAVAIMATLHGYGPLVSSDQNESLLLIQILIISAVLVCLPVAAEVSQRQSAEESLRNSVKQLASEKATDEALLNSIGDGIVATDRKGKIILVNRMFEHLLGWGQEEVLGKSTFDIIKMEDEKNRLIPEKNRPLRQASLTGIKVSAVYYLVRKDKSVFPAAVTATPIILDGKIIGVIKIFHDVSKEIEIDKAKSEFVSLASHQLRTPLTVIKWYVGTLLRKGVGNFKQDQLEKYLRLVGNTNKNMIELVNAILNVSRIELGILNVDPVPIELSKILDEVIQEFQIRIGEKQLAVDKNFIKLPLIKLDPNLVKVIFENLLSNSIKYTKPGGRIFISTTMESKEVVIKVVDTGIGIPADQKDKIFNKLFRADNAASMDAGGTGLGLYVVKAVLDKTNGRIVLESQENKGTTFYVYLPLKGMKKQTGGKGLVQS
jgi:PAS domain S-box-containing protein